MSEVDDNNEDGACDCGMVMSVLRRSKRNAMTGSGTMRDHAREKVRGNGDEAHKGTTIEEEGDGVEVDEMELN